MIDISQLLVHTVEIEPYLGTTASGPAWGPAETVAAFVDDQTRIVRAPDGRELASSATVIVALDTDVTTEARVTVRGHPARVVTVRRRDGGGLPTPDHTEIILE